MGWDGHEWHKGRYPGGLKQYLTERFSQESERIKSTVLMYSRKGYSTHFLGVEQTVKETGYKEIFLAVVLTRFYKNSYGGMDIMVKEMEESMGPCELAPKTVIAWVEKNIPNPPNEWAKNYREASKSQAPIPRRKRQKRYFVPPIKAVHSY